MKVLSIQNVTKRFGKITAVNNLSLQIEQGEIWGLLGPNGSGKTTTLAMILDILKPDSGSYTWFENLYGPKYRQQVGAILETPNFYPYLNAIDNLKIVQQIKQSDHDDLESLLKTVGLFARRFSSFGSYSLGMKQRLAIAGTLIGDPKVLIFDEPTNGLDPMGIIEIRETLIQIGQTGKTIIMASHILDEVEKICQHVAILKRGKLIRAGRVGQILGDQKVFRLASSDLVKLETALLNHETNAAVHQERDHLIWHTHSDLSGQYLNEWLFDQGIILSHLTEMKPSLEQEFLSLVKDA